MEYRDRCVRRICPVVTALMMLAILAAGCSEQRTTAPTTSALRTEYDGTIAAVGDSLTAGYGVNEEDAYPAQLETLLRKDDMNWRVVNAGISGETSSGTLSRINWILKLKPDIVILETGANDGLRGIDPSVTRRNIDEIVRMLQENRVTVVLAGMRMVTNLGRDYTRAFAALYPAVGKKYGLIMVSFFLQGVAGEPGLNQADGIHPTAEGYRIVARNVYPAVRDAVARAGKR